MATCQRAIPADCDQRGLSLDGFSRHCGFLNGKKIRHEDREQGVGSQLSHRIGPGWSWWREETSRKILRDNGNLGSDPSNAGWK